MPDLILLLTCLQEDLPVSIPGKKRSRTGRFRGEISPEPLVAVTSLEEVPGQPRVFQDLTTGSCHVLLQCVPLLFFSELDCAAGIALALSESSGQCVLYIFLSGENLQYYLKTQPAELLGNSF